MSRILLTWELGGNLGHLWRYLPVAHQLRQRGHRVLFALIDHGRFRDRLAVAEIDSVQAPNFLDHAAASLELLNYADILAANGFGAPEPLERLMAGWSGIFNEFRPDAVVAQFAPSSLMAAHLARIPAMRVDCGFGCPPESAPFPSFRPWLNPAMDDLLAREQRVLGTINLVCAEQGAGAFARLQDVFRTDSDLLITVPELDHYTGRRGGRYVGPVFDCAGGCEPEWPAGAGPRIFVYLRPFEGLPTVLRALSLSRCRVIAFLPGIGDEFRTAFSSSTLRVSDEPVRLARLLQTTDIAITHGGHGAASACLMAGVPMLLVPQLAEQLMTVYNFERLGIGKGVKSDEVGTRFEAEFAKMVRSRSCRENAKRLSRKYAGYDQEVTVRTICDAIEKTAAGHEARSGSTQ